MQFRTFQHYGHQSRSVWTHGYGYLLTLDKDCHLSRFAHAGVNYGFCVMWFLLIVYKLISIYESTNY